MKVIQVENPIEGGKVAFDILKENWKTVHKHWDLQQEAVLWSFTNKSLRAILIFQILQV